MDPGWGWAKFPTGGRSPLPPPAGTGAETTALSSGAPTIRVARFLAAKYGRLLSIRDVRQGQYILASLY